MSGLQCVIFRKTSLWCCYKHKYATVNYDKEATVECVGAPGFIQILNKINMINTRALTHSATHDPDVESPRQAGSSVRAVLLMFISIEERQEEKNSNRILPIKSGWSTSHQHGAQERSKRQSGLFFSSFHSFFFLILRINMLQFHLFTVWRQKKKKKS